MGIRSIAGKIVNSVIGKSSTPDHSTAQPGSDQIVYHPERIYNPIVDKMWDGEKTPGEMGEVENIIPDHLRLRLRAYSASVKTDIVKIITGKFFKWVIGKGLKLQAEPNEAVLELLGYDTKGLQAFKQKAEALFQVYAASEFSDYKREDDLHQRGEDSFADAFLGGDSLCIIRVDKTYGPNMQIVDGEKIVTPIDDEGKPEGNIIVNGVEKDPKGRIVAYWVEKDTGKVEDKLDFKTERVKARDAKGRRMAWMVYGDRARINDLRGIPRISAVLEKIEKLDRFAEASVSKAEKTADVIYSIKHGASSTGENPIGSVLGPRKNTLSEESAYEKSGRTKAELMQSTSGTVINLVPDSELQSLSNPSETQFDTFYRAIFCVLCAAVDIPEEVALQKYEQNYSASRAAIGGWEYLVDIYRHKFVNKYYKPFYKIWLEWQILNGVLDAGEFLRAKFSNDFMALEAFYGCRFTGKKMPHIDPLKEIKAVREILGDKDTPLTDYEAATEMMGLGDWGENMKKYKEQQKIKPEENANSENKDNRDTVEPEA